MLGRTMLACAAIGLCAAAGPTWSATYTVHPDGSGDFPTIQAAVDAAQAGDEIVLASGTFIGEGNRGIRILGKAITIRSTSGNPADCVVDCQGFDRGFSFRSISAGVVVLEGVTITGGARVEWGGGIESVSADLIMRNCNVVGNEAVEGGGLFLQWSESTIEGCLFARNVSSEYPGGGIFSAASTTIRNCTLVGNKAGPGRDGGGLACAGFSYRRSRRARRRG